MICGSDGEIKLAVCSLKRIKKGWSNEMEYYELWSQLVRNFEMELFLQSNARFSGISDFNDVTG